MNISSLKSQLIIFFWIGFLSHSLAQQNHFSAGAAKRIITPDPLIGVSGGIGQPKSVTKKYGDLYIRVLVLEKDTTTVAFVGIDNLGWSSALGNRSRALIKEILPENIMIGATHTHSAPDAYAFPDEDGNIGADMDYINWCVEEVANTVKDALANLQPASLKVAMGEAKGKIAFNYYAPDLYDPTCAVLQAVSSEDGKAIATMVNYAVHPEVIGPDQGVLSPDLCGPLYDRIESKEGGIAIFMNSAQGGMVTADNRREGKKEEQTWEECKRIGELLADQALEILAAAPLLSNPVLFCTAKTVSFPVESPIIKFILERSPLSQGTLKGGKISTQLNLVNVGTAQMITIPGEALPNIGYYLKRNMKGTEHFLLGLTNDAFGYILTKVDYNSFKRYEYITRTCLGEMTGEILIEEVLKLIEGSPPPQE